jgi:multidrug efflux pump subunit AcrB
MAKKTLAKGSAANVAKTINRAVDKSIKGPSNSDLAAKIAGTSDKKSNAYKAAIRNLQRYAKGQRKPSEAAKKALAKAKREIKKERKAKFKLPSGTVEVSGVVQVSNEKRRRSISIQMSGGDMEEFQSIAKEEGEDAAMDYAFSVYFQTPGEPTGMYLLSGTVGVTFD